MANEEEKKKLEEQVEAWKNAKINSDEGGFGNTGGGFQSNIAPTETFQNASDKAQEITANLATPATPATATATAEETGSADWVQNFLDQNLESPDEKKKRERREATNSVIYGIGDAARAIGNLYATTKYAPNGYDAKNSMSAANQARVDKATAERNAMRDWYLNYALNMNKMQNGERAWKRQQEQDVQAQKNFEAGMEHKKTVEENKMLLRTQQLAEKIRHNKATEDEKAEYNKLSLDLRARGVAVQEFNAQSNRIRALRTGSGGGSGRGNTKAYHIVLGEINSVLPEEYQTAEEYTSSGTKKIDWNKVENKIGAFLADPNQSDEDKNIVRQYIRENNITLGNGMNQGGSSSSQGNGGSSNGREHAGVRS